MKSLRRPRVLLVTALCVALTATPVAAVSSTPSPLAVVQAQLAAASSTVALPAAISPATSTWGNLATTDFGNVITGGGSSPCWIEAEATSALPTCTFGLLSAKRTLVLTGDSTAYMWEPAFDAWGLAAKWKVVVLTKGACSPWPDAATTTNAGVPFTGCHNFQVNVARFINSTKPTVVLAAGLMPVIAVGLRTVARFRADVAQFVSSLAPSGARVLVADPTPTFSAYGYATKSTISAPGCLVQHAADIRVCDGALKAQMLEYWSTVVLTKNPLPPHVSMVPLSQLLCATNCPMQAATTLVYIDSDHVSAQWARHCAAALGQILAGFVPA